jgi:hypothetical protein
MRALYIQGIRVLSRFTLIICFFLSACSSNRLGQGSCNFAEGAIGSSDAITAIILGGVNAATQNPQYDCVRKDTNMCMDSEGKIKEKCLIKE